MGVKGAVAKISEACGFSVLVGESIGVIKSKNSI
jgi:hypothetical protein